MIGRSNQDGQKLRTCTVVIVGLVIGLLIGTCRWSAPAAADPIAIKVQGPDTVGNPLPIQLQPPGASGTTQTQVTSSTTGAASAITATLTGTAGKTTYITGFQVGGGGATAASDITVTVTGTVSGTMSYVLHVPVVTGNPGPQLIVTFPSPIAASATNVSIVVNVPSFGAGNLISAVAAQGFQQ